MEFTDGQVAGLLSGQALTPAGIALVVAFVVISLGVHEAAHAFAAYRLGDPTAKNLGRMTVNPIPHIDPLMTIVLPAITLLTVGFIFGGAKPVPVVPRNFKHPNRDNAIVAIAGPLSNLLLSVLFLTVGYALLASDTYRGDQVLPRVLFASGVANLILAVFNLLPIPPLDGSRVVSWLLPPQARASYNGLERFGLLIIVGLFWLYPPFGYAIWSTMTALFNAILQAIDATLGQLF
jgi:Zn-dependent protease